MAPAFTLDEHSREALYLAEQKLILRAYSESAIRTYKHELCRFLKYFEGKDLRSLTKGQIEGYAYHLATKYRIGESKQNGMINAINVLLRACAGDAQGVLHHSTPQAIA